MPMSVRSVRIRNAGTRRFFASVVRHARSAASRGGASGEERSRPVVPPPRAVLLAPSRRVTRVWPAPLLARFIRALSEMTHGPGDELGVALEVPLVTRPSAQHVRDVARHARLLGDDEDGHGEARPRDDDPTLLPEGGLRLPFGSLRARSSSSLTTSAFPSRSAWSSSRIARRSAMSSGIVSSSAVSIARVSRSIAASSSPSSRGVQREVQTEPDPPSVPSDPTRRNYRNLLAEEEEFEPTEPLRVRRFSKASTKCPESRQAATKFKRYASLRTRETAARLRLAEMLPRFGSVPRSGALTTPCGERPPGAHSRQGGPPTPPARWLARGRCDSARVP